MPNSYIPKMNQVIEDYADLVKQVTEVDAKAAVVEQWSIERIAKRDAQRCDAEAAITEARSIMDRVQALDVEFDAARGRLDIPAAGRISAESMQLVEEKQEVLKRVRAYTRRP